MIVWSSYLSHLPVVIGHTLMGLHCTDIVTKAFWEEVFNFLCKYSYGSRPVQDLSKFNNIEPYYSLSDSSLAITFATFLGQNVQVFHPNLANMLGALLRVCINNFFVSTPQNVDFAH